MTGGGRHVVHPRRTQDQPPRRPIMLERLKAMRDRYSKGSWVYNRLDWMIGIMSK